MNEGNINCNNSNSGGSNNSAEVSDEVLDEDDDSSSSFDESQEKPPNSQNFLKKKKKLNKVNNKKVYKNEIKIDDFKIIERKESFQSFNENDNICLDLNEDKICKCQNESEIITLKVLSMDEKKFSIEMNKNQKVSELKNSIMNKSTVPENRQRLIYKGKLLEDNNTLRYYNLKNDDCIHFIAKLENVDLNDANSSNNFDNRANGRNFGNNSTNITEIRSSIDNIFSDFGSIGLDAGIGVPLGIGVSQNRRVLPPLVPITFIRNSPWSTSRSPDDVIKQNYTCLLQNNLAISEMMVNSAFSSNFCKNTNLQIDFIDFENRIFSIGQWVDVKDTVRQWLEGEIIDIKEEFIDINENLDSINSSPTFQRSYESPSEYSNSSRRSRNNSSSRNRLYRNHLSNIYSNPQNLLERNDFQMLSNQLRRTDNDISLMDNQIEKITRKKITKVKIHYIGWGETWDEWIISNSKRIMPFRYFTNEKYRNRICPSAREIKNNEDVRLLSKINELNKISEINKAVSTKFKNTNYNDLFVNKRQNDDGKNDNIKINSNISNLECGINDSREVNITNVLSNLGKNLFIKETYVDCIKDKIGHLKSLKSNLVYEENQIQNTENLKIAQNSFYLTLKQLQPILDRTGRSMTDSACLIDNCLQKNNLSKLEPQLYKILNERLKTNNSTSVSGGRVYNHPNICDRDLKHSVSHFKNKIPLLKRYERYTDLFDFSGRNEGESNLIFGNRSRRGNPIGNSFFMRNPFSNSNSNNSNINSTISNNNINVENINDNI